MILNYCSIKFAYALNKVMITQSNTVMLEGQSIENPNEIAEAFNNHFATIGPKMADKI